MTAFGSPCRIVTTFALVGIGLDGSSRVAAQPVDQGRFSRRKMAAERYCAKGSEQFADQSSDPSRMRIVSGRHHLFPNIVQRGEARRKLP